MSQLLNLPLLEGNKLIVIDEGSDSSCGRNLIIAWLQEIRKKRTDSSVKILLFSHPKKYFHSIFKLLNFTNLQILDYFSTDLQCDKVDLYKKLLLLLQQDETSIFIVDCLSTLALQIGTAKMCKFIEKLNNSHKFQILCIYRRDFHINIPRIKALGNIYIHLERSKKINIYSNVYYKASIIHRKSGGSIIKWNELVHQNIENFSLTTEKIVDNSDIEVVLNTQSESSLKPQTSFRIEINDNEVKQRDSLPLPYILPGNPGGESKIIYVPDDVDDLDEEDPDDDLDI